MSQDRGPRCPDLSSAKSRLSACFSKTVRDIPKFRPPSPVWASAISRSGQAPFQTKSRTNGEKPRDIADIGPKRVVTSRTRDLPKLVRSRTPRIGSGYRGQSAKLVTSRTRPKGAAARLGQRHRSAARLGGTPRMAWKALRRRRRAGLPALDRPRSVLTRRQRCAG